ncbi:MAG: hypothetical protein RMJ36_00585 [Candidatus Calescibacterium sp.]|nr:hypothetical protein [Candidatus Calescibacterium sp.]MDW8132141.1 hypothetical protein [Candidatus Calescibacterium sp.]
MILFLVNSKFALEIPDGYDVDFNKIYVIKLRNNYFLAFFIKTKKNLEKKLISLRKVNFVDFLNIPNLEIIVDTLHQLFEVLKVQNRDIFRYFYSGLEKIILTLVKYEDILKIFVDDIVTNIETSKKFRIKIIENNYLENKTCFFIPVSKNLLKIDNLRKIKKYFRKKLKKRIKCEITYTFQLADNIKIISDIRDFSKGFDFIYKKEGIVSKNSLNLIIVHDLERVLSKKIDLSSIYSDNIWKKGEVFNFDSNNFVFPLWGIVLSRFFDHVVLDYFPKFYEFSEFLYKCGTKIIFHSFLPLYGNFKSHLENNKDLFLKDFEIIKKKLIFENFSLKDLKLYLNEIRCKDKGFSVLFYSFYDAFYKFYCDYCGNVPFCELCNKKLKVEKRTIGNIDKLRLICQNCKVKYDTFNCQYCGKYKWKIWTKKYGEELKDYNPIFINFVPSNFKLYLSNSQLTSDNYFVVIDYYSLYKPFILKELNIWYFLFKIVNELNVRNIVFLNTDEFNVFEYFHQFIYSDHGESIIRRLSDLIEMERRNIALL